jgi:pyrroline-5-carboxylate reductase
MKGTLIAILGAGNIGTAIADGLVASGTSTAEDITLTRRRVAALEPLRERGFRVGTDNLAAARDADVVVVAVEPLQVDALLDEIAPGLVPGKHLVLSVVTGVRVAHIKAHIPAGVAVVRAMPNTAIAVRASMTCLAADERDRQALEAASSIFATVGLVLTVDEEQMIPATVLGACGVAFFLRAIRAASQGGIEIGFHSQDALAIAAQTAKGAALLLLARGEHPENEIDRVTTPRGCTIAGLNQMEHAGFSSALIRGITVSAEKAARLYAAPERK